MLGLTYQDGVMLATDTLASYGSLARFMDNQRLTPFGSHVVVGASGDMSDWQNIQHTLTKLMEKEDIQGDGHSLTPEQVRQLHRVAHTVGIPTICFGLRSDFQGNAFPGAAQLLTLADDIEEIKTICSCGRKATMNIRLDSQGQRVREGQQVEIGGNERYQQVCARCFYQEA